MVHVPISLAIAAALTLTEIRWWEGSWVDKDMACKAATGDARPIVLSWDSLRFVESECAPVRELSRRDELIIEARCRNHGEPAERALEIRLEPSDGGRAMVMRMGGAEWRLRKCPRT